MNPQWIIGPAVGAVIGYITNEIAIRMLFRPYRAIHIWGKRLPFTPGLIPKERHRLAQAISDLVSRQLLNEEILTESLLSAEMRGKIDRTLEEALERLAEDERSARSLLTQEGQEQALQDQISQASQQLARFGCQKLLESGFSQVAAQTVILDLRQRLLQSPMSPLRLFWDDRLTQTLTDKLATVLEEMVENKGPDLLQGMLTSAADGLLDKPLGEHYQSLVPYIPALREKLHAQYEKLVREQLARLLGAVDIGRIVEDRVNGLDVAELEYLILGLMRKELRAVVMLGGVLGGIMGLVNAVMAIWF